MLSYLLRLLLVDIPPVSAVPCEFIREVNTLLKASSSVYGGRLETSIVHSVILNGNSAAYGEILLICLPASGFRAI